MCIRVSQFPFFIYELYVFLHNMMNQVEFVKKNVDLYDKPWYVYFKTLSFFVLSSLKKYAKMIIKTLLKSVKLFKLAKFLTDLAEFWEIIGRGSLENFGNTGSVWCSLSPSSCSVPPSYTHKYHTQGVQNHTHTQWLITQQWEWNHTPERCRSHRSLTNLSEEQKIPENINLKIAQQ